MNKINLSRVNFIELSDQESISTEGGSLRKFAKGGIWAYLASEIIDHWESIKKGASSGWNFDNKNNK